jgi:dephospho-CoA kinase
VSKWPDKYVIGLTGNIATGKSVVRKMLERLGAFGIDADSLGHRAIAKDAPGYHPIINTFGHWLLNEDLQINRSRLSSVVFNNPDALQYLESIVHPLVFQAVDIIIRRASQPVIVLEAIKLLESGLAKNCDSIWVVTSERKIQVSRLVNQRKLNSAEANLRIDSQPPQKEKIALANVVITNNGSFEETWHQVQSSWRKISLPTSILTTPPLEVTSGDLKIRRGSPRDFQAIVGLVNRVDPDGRKRNKTEFASTLNDNAFLLLEIGNKLVGLIGWQIENLICRTTDIYLDPAIPSNQSIPLLINEVESAAKDLQCEASLLFLSPPLSRLEEVWRPLGYEIRTPQSLEVQAWQEAALESMPFGTQMCFKQLRQDRVLRPI